MGSVTTAWARHAEQLVVEPRCRSASLSIGYAMAIHKPMAVGGTRVVGSGMRVGRPAGGSVVAAPDGATQERLVPRRVVVGNLGYDVSFTLPKSYSLLLAFAHDGTAAAVEAVYTEAVGAPSAGWSASAPTGCAATTATARARPRWPAPVSSAGRWCTGRPGRCTAGGRPALARARDAGEHAPGRRRPLVDGGRTLVDRGRRRAGPDAARAGGGQADPGAGAQRAAPPLRGELRPQRLHRAASGCRPRRCGRSPNAARRSRCWSPTWGSTPGRRPGSTHRPRRPPLRRRDVAHALRCDPQGGEAGCPDAAGRVSRGRPRCGSAATNDAVAAGRGQGVETGYRRNEAALGRCRGERVAHHGADHERPTE